MQVEVGRGKEKEMEKQKKNNIKWEGCGKTDRDRE